jgi:hypothetical protein
MVKEKIRIKNKLLLKSRKTKCCICGETE